VNYELIKGEKIMHGLQTLAYLNYQTAEQQKFIDDVLSKPRPPEQNLLEVWLDWKKEQEQKQNG
jgi:hypothetical protein